MDFVPTTQCVKVAALRKEYPGENIDLEKWMKKDNTLYVGRSGRIFIKDPDGTNRVFHYKGSIWGNPYKVGDEYSLEESLKLYEKHIVQTGLINKIGELKGKVLGCFCDQKSPCHAKVLVDLYKKLYF